MIDSTFLYALVYEKGFSIPEGFECVKQQLEVRISGMKGVLARKMLRRRIKSVPSVVGLKVGDFHMLERVSTPIFIDFVVHNIVNLLVML